MKQDGLIRHIGISNVSADQLLTALAITDIAAVTVRFNVAVRLGATVRAIAQNKSIVFSPWHPGAVPGGDDGVAVPRRHRPDRREVRATPAADRARLATSPHTQALPIPGTTSVQHLKENLAAANIQLADEEVARSPQWPPRNPDRNGTMAHRIPTPSTD